MHVDVLLADLVHVDVLLANLVLVDSLLLVYIGHNATPFPKHKLRGCVYRTQATTMSERIFTADRANSEWVRLSFMLNDESQQHKNFALMALKKMRAELAFFLNVDIDFKSADILGNSRPQIVVFAAHTYVSQRTSIGFAAKGSRTLHWIVCVCVFMLCVYSNFAR